MNEKPLISFKNVSFSYPDHDVFSGVDVKLFAHEFVGVIGPNGCGKSTLFKLILDLLKPSCGRIEKDPTLSCIGYVPQHTRYDPLFPASVLEIIMMGATSELNWRRSRHSEFKARARAWLEKFDLTVLENRPFYTLSGGQMQKVLIIRALILNPKLILLDEPTNHVDKASASVILKFLKMLKHEKTVVMITHDFDAVVNNVDRILSLQKGIVSLKPGEVCHHFAMGLYHDKKELS